MYADDDTPTEPLPRITGTAPILPRRIEEPELPVEYVQAPRSPFLIPGVAALALFTFLVGVGVATLLGVDVSAPLQAEKPQATSGVTATAKPERRHPPKDTPVEIKDRPKPDPRATNSVESPATSPAEPSSKASPLPATTTPPASPEPSIEPPTEEPTDPATPTPPAEPESPEPETPSSDPEVQTSQQADTGEPTP